MGWMRTNLFIPLPATNGEADTFGDLSLSPSRLPSEVPSPVSPRNSRTPPRAHHKILCGDSLVTPPRPNLSHTNPAGPTTCHPDTLQLLIQYIRKPQIDESHVIRPPHIPDVSSMVLLVLLLDVITFRPPLSLSFGSPSIFVPKNIPRFG